MLTNGYKNPFINPFWNVSSGSQNMMFWRHNEKECKVAATSTWFKQVLVCTTIGMQEGPLHCNSL